jgi:beta-fructofuranosidase
VRDLEGEKAIREAMIAVRGVISTAEEDPQRPGFHFRPPARWMNDPNGPIFYDGWYHLFYQHNPYGDGWGNMHWGHARSRDLVDWEHLPIALWPSKSKGEQHVFSGSTFLDDDGRPSIIYTSIGRPDPEQWLARPLDDDLIEWEKAGTALTASGHRPFTIEEWRDPFVVSWPGHRWIYCGGRHEGRGMVARYVDAGDGSERWSFSGIVFHHPTLDLIECPNLVHVGEKQILLTSMHGRIEAFVGGFSRNGYTFVPERSAIVAAGSYASQTGLEKDGSVTFYSWINVGGAVGWTGCMALPCILDLDDEDHPTLTPIPALRKLRESTQEVKGKSLTGTLTLDDIGNQVELILDLDPGLASRIELELAFSGPDQPSHRVAFDPATFTLTTPRGSVVIRPAASLKLHIFLDRIVMDLYADGGRVSQNMGLSREPKGEGFRLHSIGGAITINSLQIHRLRSAEFDLTHFH